MDYGKEAERHREISEWYRIMANDAADHGLRARYAELAASYERLAEDELRVARNQRRVN